MLLVYFLYNIKFILQFLISLYDDDDVCLLTGIHMNVSILTLIHSPKIQAKFTYFGTFIL